jgi:hypothetical protein
MAGISDDLRFKFTTQPGTRVKRISSGQVGTLIQETYRGPWGPKFLHAWWVHFDDDYTCRVQDADLTQDLMAPRIVPNKPRRRARKGDK